MKHMVEFLLPGAFFPEKAVREVSDRTIAAVWAVDMPPSAYCFEFYDIEEPPDLGPEFKVAPVPKNRSAKHYIGGTIYDITEIEAMGEDKHILHANMRGNGWQRVIRCRSGNWQPFEDHDVRVMGMSPT